jgi:phosphomannomutase
MKNTKAISAQDLSAAVRQTVRSLNMFDQLPNCDQLVQGLEKYLNGDAPNLWEAANLIGNYYNSVTLAAGVETSLRETITVIREFQGRKAQTSTEPTLVVFGTSGWRGVIGEDFTVRNVHKVVRGIVEMMRSPEFCKVNGCAAFADVQKAGLVVLRDNRFMGDVFKDAAMRELAAAGIKIYDAGECPTGVGSALVTELHAAGSINFTPSHNPMDYAGIKFNPADGGPADTGLTSIIEQKANGFMTGEFTPATADYTMLRQQVDAADIFTTFVAQKSRVFNLKDIRAWLKQNKNDLCLIVDFMHGAARGYIERVLGAELVRELQAAQAVFFLHADDDPSFHGVKPEPSAKNQAPLVKLCQQAGRKYSLAVALDPDADRIRFADAVLDLDMNLFGAVAFAALTASASFKSQLHYGVASTAPSSDFALEIARQQGRPVFETAVGFKYFRGPFKKQQALVAFEESDGISFLGHTLEKCALAGFLMALTSMMLTGKNISAQYAELRKKYGYFYPGKAGADVKGVSIEAWQAYKKAVVAALQTKLFKAGDMVTVGNEAKQIVAINTIDGLKVVFEDKSWILLRPSGTEPKFRYYYEVAGQQELGNAAEKLKEYQAAAAAILQKARDLVDCK